MNSKEFKSGQVIFKQGDSELCMYDIQKGRVGIYSEYGTPAEKLIAELSIGEVVGDRGLLERTPRSATAVALEDDTILMEIREDNLKDYFLKEPEKLLLLMRNLSDRLRKINGKLADVCRKIYEAENT